MVRLTFTFEPKIFEAGINDMKGDEMYYDTRPNWFIEDYKNIDDEFKNLIFESKGFGHDFELIQKGNVNHPKDLLVKIPWKNIKTFFDIDEKNGLIKLNPNMTSSEQMEVSQQALKELKMIMKGKEGAFDDFKQEEQEDETEG